MNPSFIDLGLAQTTLHPLGLEVLRAQGSYLYHPGGKRTLDFISGIGVSSFGHSHPEIIAAIHDQVDRHLHVMVYGEFRQSAQQQAAEHLLALLPSHLDSVYFVNSGAEAIDAAMKLTRRSTQRQKIYSFHGGYHGNTFGALSVSANAERKEPFAPLVGDVEQLPWNDFEGLERIDDRTAGVVLETIQGDAGIRIPDETWMLALRRRCSEVGAKLVLDEIQCGMGRTGKPFAFEHFGLVPDYLCLGKALGGGMPMGALVAPSHEMLLFADNPSLGHITTFGGHPVSCAASAVATRLLAHTNWEHIEKIGKTIEDRMWATGKVRKIRRKGLYIAVELADADEVQRVVNGALELGVLIFYFLSTPQAFRIAPALTITEEELNFALDVLANVLDDEV